MKTKIKGYWVLIVLFFLINIGIFMFFSKHLEGFMVSYTIEVQTKGGLK